MKKRKKYEKLMNKFVWKKVGNHSQPGHLMPDPSNLSFEENFRQNRYIHKQLDVLTPKFTFSVARYSR